MDPGDRVRASFERQQAMATLGARLLRVDAGEVEIEIEAAPRLSQQHGYMHGGVVATAVDSACGYAALSVAPEGSEVLTIGYAIDFVAPARGARIRAVGRVRRAGRHITICAGDAFAVDADGETLVATMLATIMTVPAAP